MKFRNIYNQTKGGFESQLVKSHLGFGTLVDCHTHVGVKPLLPIANFSPRYVNKYQSNFFIMNDKDDKLLTDLRFKDIFAKPSKSEEKLEQHQNNATSADETDEESWRYNRKWLSTVFMIWFFLAFALLLNAIYY